MKNIFLAAGCFWGVEHKFSNLKGVIDTQVGYMGGSLENPKYDDVCTDTTNHAEIVKIKYNENIISTEKILNYFFDIHNPTQKNRQGPNIGTQYRSIIFYTEEEQKIIAQEIIAKLDSSGKYKNYIETEVIKQQTFWKAEEYHQKYLQKKGANSCNI
ncbi:MAG: peptide-methionine (S)-S-oxide reductase MsrA [Candidatus Muirbacterium halophilum]|nr:peptide-methionine (S)-S-oxide reductase MsrA [Candidatus Muirbacterium halophilum]MCK9476107.1 peptide-methionine (S)-S-oxide reductase MsrA [Candidatus Muirbacterium halophilum]